jgi:hypothetical protein
MRVATTESRTIEGIWEDVARHGPELAGKRVQLTVLDERNPQTATLDAALATIVEAAEALAAKHPRVEHPQPPHDWSEGVVNKFSRQGFDL